MVVKRFRHKKISLFGLLVLLLVAAFTLKLTSVHAQNIDINGTQNCDANAVIWCGASSVDQIIERYNGGDGHNSAASISHIYSYFGISSSDINSLNSANADVISGYVTKGNKVYGVDNKLIATDALTAGRQNIAGSSTVNFDGTTFYTRTPSVSFISDYLPAYIVMINNKFDFAILSSCCNPVIATPVPVPTSPPTPVTPPPPAPVTTVTPTPATTQTTPSYSYCSGSTTNTGNTNNASGGNCSTNTNISQVQTSSPQQVASAIPPVTSSTTTSVSPPTSPTTLVNTGPGSTLAIFGGTALAGTIFYQMVIRKKLAKELIKDQ